MATRNPGAKGNANSGAVRCEVVQLWGDHGSVWTFLVQALESNERFLIGVDHRPAFAITEALASGEVVHVDVDPWQILAEWHTPVL